jgi:hypothetical protein
MPAGEARSTGILVDRASAASEPSSSVFSCRTRPRPRWGLLTRALNAAPETVWTSDGSTADQTEGFESLRARSVLR